MELLNALTDRTVVVSLAILGATIATAGGMFGRKRTNYAAKLGRILIWIGYTISFASVALFVIAGFMANR